MAFTVDLTGDVGIALPWDGGNKHFVIQKTVDFSVTANNLANTATMGLFTIPGGVLVEEVIIRVDHLSDADSDDINIGSYSTAGVAVDATGFGDHFTHYQTGQDGFCRDVAGQTYSLTDGTAGFVRATDWTLGIANDDTHTLDHGILTFIAICKDLR